LFIGIEKEDLSGVRQAILSGACVNSRDKSGRSPIEVALDRQRLDVLRLLLVAGGDPNAPTRGGHSYVRYLLERIGRSGTGFVVPDKEIELLLSAGMEPGIIDERALYLSSQEYPELLATFKSYALARILKANVYTLGASDDPYSAISGDHKLGPRRGPVYWYSDRNSNSNRKK
jgi:hypothetical protein